MKYTVGDKVISKIGNEQYPEGAWTGLLTVTTESTLSQFGPMYRARNESGLVGWHYEENLLPVSTESMFREFSDEDMEMELHRRQKGKRDAEVNTLMLSAVTLLESGGFAVHDYDVKAGEIQLDLSEFDN